MVNVSLADLAEKTGINLTKLKQFLLDKIFLAALSRSFYTFGCFFMLLERTQFLLVLFGFLVGFD